MEDDRRKDIISKSLVVVEVCSLNVDSKEFETLSKSNAESCVEDKDDDIFVDEDSNTLCT